MNAALIYNLVLFLHILGAFGLIAAITFEAIGLFGLRRAARAEEALTWLGVGRMVQRLAPASLGLILLTGIYMWATSWGPRGWIIVALGAFLAIAVIGTVGTGLRMARIGPAVGRAAGSGPLSDEVRRALRDPVMLISFGTRLGIVLGILFLMTVKPSPIASLVVVVVGAIIGALTASLPSGTRNQFQPQDG